MKIVLLDRATLGDDLDLAPLARQGTLTEYESTSADQVAERIADADVVVVNKIKLGAHNLSHAHALRLICVTATGYDNIDTDYCRTAGIAVCNVPAYSTESVAQLTLSMALCLVNRLGEYRDFVHRGDYALSAQANRLTPPFHELSSLTWGVLGGGSIGGRVADLAAAFGCRVLVCRRKPELRYEAVDLDTLCRESDILSLHVPLTEKTRGMISREKIALMKQDAIVINVARGAVADEEALAEAVENGRLGGLGADVYAKEPLPADHPFGRLYSRPNVCLTPHMAWSAIESRKRCLATVAENIAVFRSGRQQNRIV